MIAGADIGSLKSLHKLFNKYLDHTHWWNLNKIVWSELYKINELFYKKMAIHFWQSVDAILEDVLWL